MRSILLLAVLALGGLAAVPSVAGLVPVPLACVPLCEVPSHTNAGFLPPVTVVRSGATVTWTTLDTVHTASDEVDLCFHVVYYPNVPGGATFVREGDVLFATSEGGGEHVECTAASPLPDGSISLEYVCFYHPNTMIGILVVK